MFVVIFEVEPRPERHQEYLQIATELKSELERIDGFISVERFSGIHNKGKILSLSYWRDEESILKWRTHILHQEAQYKGRHTIFWDYDIKVAHVIRNYGMFDRIGAPS